MKTFNYFDKKGFTLMELIVTVILVAILATYAVYHYTSTMREGEVKAARGKMAALGGALERFKIEYGEPELTGPIKIESNIFNAKCNYHSDNPETKIKSIFSCGYVEKFLGFDQHFDFYFGSPDNGKCGGNITILSVFMFPKKEFESVPEYPKCAYFNPYTDSTVEVVDE